MTLYFPLLLLLLCCNASNPMRQFVRAWEHRDMSEARRLCDVMLQELVEQNHLRLSTPAGQQLRWQLNRKTGDLGRVYSLCVTYLSEIQRMISGFMTREQYVEDFFTNKLVALYHLRERVHHSRRLSLKEKESLQQAISQVGTADGPHVEALRKRLLVVYNSQE